MSIPKNIFAEFFSYLRKPTYNFDFEHNSRPFWSVFRKVALLFIFTFILAIFFAATSNLILEKIAYKGKHINEVNDPLLSEILSEALLTGILEELCFRLYLKFSVVSVALLSFGSGLWISGHFIRDTNLTFPISFICTMGLATLVAVPCYFILKQNQETSSSLSALYYRKFPYIFYFSALFFGWIHIFNYNLLTPVVILASPLITLPQISIGFTLGFIRMKYGMKWNYGYHIIHNFLAILLFS